MKRRPTAEDRELADVFRGLKPNSYHVDVYAREISLMHLAPLKTEGSITIKFDDKIINIVPQTAQKAAA